MTKVSYYKIYMERALTLAARGWGRVSPNPMVGAVIIKGGRIVGYGYHKGPGRDHAEVAAIKNAGRGAKGGTLIANLEPCNHYGHTPPCTEAIIKSGITKVVFGMRDPNPKSKEGLVRLRNAGVSVTGPLLEEECRLLNRIYLHWIKTSCPYIISHVAVSLDGKLAAENGSSQWISGEKCRQRAHYWRAGVDAVLVGAETVRKDDPLLNARNVGRVKQPMPIVVTSSGRLGSKRRLWERIPPPLVVCRQGTPLTSLQRKGVEILPLRTRGSRLRWEDILKALGKRGITSILVEGGGTIHSQLVAQGLTDYLVASVSTKLIGGKGRDWLPGWGVNDIRKALRVRPEEIWIVDGDVMIEGEICYR